MLKLFVIPVENVIKQKSDLITYNATKNKYFIQPSQKDMGLCLHSVCGVYENTKDGLKFLSSRLLYNDALCFEIDVPFDISEKKPATLYLDYPEAFDDPIDIIVEALWHQPEFNKHLWDKVLIKALTLNIPSIKWVLTVKPNKLRNTFNKYNPECFLKLSSLQNKIELCFDEVVMLLNAMSNVGKSKFAEAASKFVDLKTERVKQKKRKEIIYHLKFNAVHNNIQKNLIEVFAYRLRRILRAWSQRDNLKVRTRLTME